MATDDLATPPATPGATASPPGRRFLVGDVLAGAVVALAVWAAVTVHAAVSALAEPARRAAVTADTLADRLASTAEGLGRLPLVGDEAAAPLDGASRAGAGLADAARETVERVDHLALVLALVTVGLPVAIALVLRLLPRRREARRLGERERLLATPGGRRLLALRRLLELPGEEALRLHPDPVRGLLDDDPGVLERLTGPRGSGRSRRGASPSVRP
ncbi:hypothetical protein ACFFKU_00825 [Kineococcus gynurae]|uniref:Uncharacterized protein n=1 Tax=Kineococcus gynurae TaxID=452979 RepID=A0ABV5LPS0_9ACTN